MEIIEGHRSSSTQRTVLADALLAAFGTQYPSWTTDEAVQELAAPGPVPFSLIACEGDQPLGCASLLDDDEVSGWDGRTWLGNVIVLESARGRGIGSALVDAIEQRATRLGVRELHLVTTTAIDWYERRGWSVRGSADVHGHAMTVMHKSL